MCFSSEIAESSSAAKFASGRFVVGDAEDRARSVPGHDGPFLVNVAVFDSQMPREIAPKIVRSLGIGERRVF